MRRPSPSDECPNSKHQASSSTISSFPAFCFLFSDAKVPPITTSHPPQLLHSLPVHSLLFFCACLTQKFLCESCTTQSSSHQPTTNQASRCKALLKMWRPAQPCLYENNTHIVAFLHGTFVAQSRRGYQKRPFQTGIHPHTTLIGSHEALSCIS
jgi:hypothetical protein